MGRWAVLDMGTNTFLFLLGEWRRENNKLIIIADEHRIARLGEGVSQPNRITESSVERARNIALEYNELCCAYLPQKLWAVGTAVFRRAQNGKEVAQDILQVFSCCPVVATVLAPEEEALFSFWGAVLPSPFQGPTVVIDIGGGSTEIILGHGIEVVYRTSLPIGALWLWEEFSKDQDFEAAHAFVGEVIRSHLPREFVRPAVAYAVAGTPVTLAGILQGVPYGEWWRVQGAQIRYSELLSLLSWLWHTSVEERRRHPCIHPERADILPAGALILAVLMEYLRLPSLRVSIYGLRYGVFYELLRREEGFNPAEPFQLRDPRLTP
jgi:exopolyphosphatase/guanosine-5'-triphosphate,3'-diphosphate pyrophosphatase